MKRYALFTLREAISLGAPRSLYPVFRVLAWSINAAGVVHSAGFSVRHPYGSKPILEIEGLNAETLPILYYVYIYICIISLGMQSARSNLPTLRYNYQFCNTCRSRGYLRHYNP